MAGGGGSHLQQGPTASHPTYRLIQVLRAVAALMVVVNHSTIVLHARTGLPVAEWRNGVTGVDIFFVISGFVMMISSAPLRSTMHAARTFLARRIERIVPMYWIATTAKLIAVLAVPAIALEGAGSVWHVVASYLFLPSRGPTQEYGQLLAVGWTLNFEMAFYVLFAIALAVRRPPLRVLAPILIALAFAWEIPQLVRHGTVHFYESPMELEFLFGLLLGSSVHWLRRIPAWLGAVGGAAGLAVLFAWRAPYFMVWRGVLWGAAAMAVVAGAIVLEERMGRRAPRWMLELGDASYSIYLFHGFALPIAALLVLHVGGRSPLLAVGGVAVMTIVSTAFGELVYRAVERPMMRWLKGRRPTAIPVNA